MVRSFPWPGLTIESDGSGPVIIDGSSNSAYLFDISTTSEVEIRGVTIRDFTSSSSAGALLLSSTVTLNVFNSSFVNCVCESCEGGSISATGAASVKLVSSNFTDGSASNGGAVSLTTGGTFVSRGTTFTNCVSEPSSGQGGALYLLAASNALETSIYSTVFERCSAYKGGAVYLIAYYPAHTYNIINSEFTDVSATGHGGAVTIKGPSVGSSSYAGQRVTGTITGCSFTSAVVVSGDDDADCDGNAYNGNYCGGGAIAVAGYADIYLTSSTFKSCSSNTVGGTLAFANGEYSNSDFDTASISQLSDVSISGSIADGDGTDLYVSGDHQTFSCIPTTCTAGSYNNKTYLADCYNDNNAGGECTCILEYDCTECEAGTFSSEDGADLCTNCRRGQYSSVAGSTSCSDCLAGTFAAENASTTCSDCPTGAYNTKSRSTECTLCGAGKYNEVIAASSASDCTDCPTGRYGTLMGQTNLGNCTQCEPGRYNEETAQSSSAACIACSTGKYLAVPGGISECDCEDCPSGKYASSTGSSSCDVCPNGTAADGGNSHCEICTAGKYQNATGASSCKDCAAGTISLDRSAVCTQCPAGKKSDGDNCEDW